LKSKAMILALLMLCMGLAGCTGDDEHEDEEGPDWINDRGDAAQIWNISLEKDEWIEVQSVKSLGISGGDQVMSTSFIVSEEGFSLSEGFSAMFGGNYTMCYRYDRYDGCLNEDPDGDNDGYWAVSEWSIIYRIHEV
jgi:hypothetical protein